MTLFSILKIFMKVFIEITMQRCLECLHKIVIRVQLHTHTSNEAEVTNENNLKKRCGKKDGHFIENVN